MVSLLGCGLVQRI